MNAAYSRITISPIGEALAAEIGGVDLAEPLDEATRKEILTAFTEHQVVAFRGQNLTPARQCEIARLFGPLARTPFVKALPGHPDVVAIIKEPQDTKNLGEEWHSDSTWQEKPALGLALYALQVPPTGGDTLFSNGYAAYDALSPGMKDLCDQLIVVHSAAKVYAPERGADDPSRSQLGPPSMRHEFTGVDAYRECDHPLVRVHPVSGRKALYVSGVWCLRFKNMTELESKPLLDYLHQHAVRPEFTCRIKWSSGTLVVVDNRCTMHSAQNDYHGFRREVHRVVIGGERPFGPAMPEIAPGR